MHPTVRTARRLLPRAAATAATLLVLTACGTGTGSSMPGMDHGAPHGTPSAGASGAPTTTAGGTPAAGAHDDADVMFAQMMVPHHQQAVEMSDLLLAKDVIDPAVARLARQITAAQAPEITQMNGWLTGWGAPAATGTGHDMAGGMSQTAMDALQKATGDDAAELFLTGMIAHHQGAVTMAEDEIADGRNADATMLAQRIVDTQRAEISTMRELLTTVRA